MINGTSLRFRRSIIVSAALVSAVGFSYSSRASADDSKEMPIDPVAQKMVVDQVTKMKDRAADSAEKEKMTSEMAKNIVMERMAMDAAMDPQCKSECSKAVNDPNVKKIHDEAVKMAEDPQMMQKIEQEILADPKELRVVAHHALMLSLDHPHTESMDAKSDTKTMGDKVKDMGDKLMDKVQK